jgi:predicted CXXCH cytochrome family protein
MRASSRIAAIRLIISMAAAVVFLAAPAAAGASTEAPVGHEPFAADSSICVVCHRAHTSTGPNLLRSAAGMCLTCHKNGVGADTDVASGKYVSSNRHDPLMGAANGNLLGGGFALLDTNSDGNLEPQAYPGTSQHRVGMTIAPFGSTYNGAAIVLECGSCHTIHKIDSPGQYRYLRQQVGNKTGLQVTWNGPWDDATQTTRSLPAPAYRAYTETDFNSAVDGIQEYTRNYQSGLSAWCSGCHSVYSTEVGPYDIGDGQGAQVRHKHKVDITLAATNRLAGSPDTDLPLNDLGTLGRSSGDTMSCVTCHRAHGTDTDSTATGAYQVASRGVLPLLKTSMLLRRDNRGVCIDCHGYLND